MLYAGDDDLSINEKRSCSYFVILFGIERY